MLFYKTNEVGLKKNPKIDPLLIIVEDLNIVSAVLIRWIFELFI
jgi:hypothetical protein